MWSYDHDKISKISIQKFDLDLSWQPARHGRPSLDSLALGRPPSDRWHLKMGMVVMEDRVVMMKMEKSNHIIILGKAPPNKKCFFWKISPKSVFPPTHYRVFVRLGKTKGEILVVEAILGVIWGFLPSLMGAFKTNFGKSWDFFHQSSKKNYFFMTK